MPSWSSKFHFFDTCPPVWRVILGQGIEKNLSSSKGVTVDNFRWDDERWSFLISNIVTWTEERFLAGKKMICVYAVFHHLFFNTFFGFLDSHLDLIEFFKCMTWQSIFLFLLFISFCSHDSSTPGNVACRRCPSSLKHLFSCKNCFERVGFWFEVACIIFAQRKDMAQKYSREMGSFWSMCLEASIKVVSECHDLGTSVFGYWKGLAGLKL